MTSDSHDEFALPIVWPLQHELPTLPANHFAISKTEEGIYLTFGELRPLIITGERSQKQLEHIREQGEVRINPLALIYVTENGFNAFLRLMVKSLETEELNELVAYIQEQLNERQDE